MGGLELHMPGMSTLLNPPTPTPLYSQSNVLVLLDSDLRFYPQAVIDAVTSFVGLPPLDLLATNASEGAAERFAAMYPAFGASTGWQLKGDYEALPPDEDRLIRAFYAPYNEALFRYLGVDLGWNGPRRGGGVS